MSRTCVRCSHSHSTPYAFLITCSECGRSWHHRCHIPPMEDDELIARFKALQDNDVDNGPDGWTCRRCLKSHRKQANFVPQPPAKVHNLSLISHQQPQSQQLDRRHGALPHHRDEPMDIGENLNGEQPLPSLNRTVDVVQPLLSAAQAGQTIDRQEPESHQHEEFMDVDDIHGLSGLEIISPFPARSEPQSRQHAELTDVEHGTSVLDITSSSPAHHPPIRRPPSPSPLPRPTPTPSMHDTPPWPGSKPDLAFGTTPDTRIASPSPLPIRDPSIPDMALQPADNLFSANLEFEPGDEVVNCHTERFDQLLTFWVLARHPDEDNPWSPFLGIKCSHQNKRRPREKGEAVHWNPAREDLLNFNLTKWVKAHRSIT